LPSTSDTRSSPLSAAGEPPRGPVDARVVPRYAGISTFARLPQLAEVDRFDVAVVGIPFDSGTTYRPGARFGPSAIRQGSRLLRTYNAAMDTEPFGRLQVVDAGDITCNPFDIQEAIGQIEPGVATLLAGGASVVALGGDHTIALPMLRAVCARFGQVHLLHFDAHLDTWDTYFGASYTHGTPFRRAVEEGLLSRTGNVHVGIRGSLYAATDLSEDAALGFEVIGATAFDQEPLPSIVGRIRARLGDAPVYVSVDIDVLDPAHAPATGTPEAGGLTSREVLALVRGLRGVRVVSADIVEVAPAYDHAEITSIAAANVAYELLTLLTDRER
jgi:agmatinase